MAEIYHVPAQAVQQVVCAVFDAEVNGHVLMALFGEEGRLQ
jgi:hypothetical protein